MERIGGISLRNMRTEDQETYQTSQSKLSDTLVSKISPIYSDPQRLPKKCYEPIDLFSDDLAMVADCLFNSIVS